MAVNPVNALSEQSDSGDTDETVSEETTDSEPTETAYANSISGILWLDANNDGTHDAGEQPIVGYTVSLYAENDRDNAVQTAVTAADGTYSFSDIEPDKYVVGIVSATVGGQEYLLPLMGIQNDNKFAIASDWINAYSEPISVGEDSTITGIDAGMRTPPKVQTMSYKYLVTNNTDYYESANDMWTVAWAITNGVGTGKGSSYTIIVQANVSENTPLILGTTYTNLDITVTSASGSSFTITADNSNYGKWLFEIEGNNLTLDNITLAGDNDYKGGGVSIKNGTLAMNSGATIKNFFDNNSDFRGVSVTNGGTFTMNGGTISGNKTTWNGGGVYLQDSTFVMGSGTISNNTTSIGGGGGVYLQDSTFNMNGGTISGNEASGNGGGVATGKGGTFNMNGGTIRNNTAAENGGGVYISAVSWDSIGANYALSSFSMNSAAADISGNTAAISGGGVYITGNNKFNMSNGLIDNNVAASGSGGGVYVYYLDTQFMDKAYFSLSGGTISNNQATGTVDSKGGGIAFHVNIAGGLDIPATLTGGVIGSNNQASIGGGLSVLNNTGNHVTLRVDGTTIINNKAIAKGTPNNYDAGDGGGIGAVNGSGGTIKLTINGNTTITGNEGGEDGNGGGVYCDYATSFEMNGGLIDGNKAARGSGGGVYFHSGSSASFAVYNGTISNNYCIWSGGGLFIGSAQNATVSGPGITITGNIASEKGGGISYENGTGTLEISGGVVISGNGGPDIDDPNTAGNHGGGIYMGVNASVKILGSETKVSGNIAQADGGGIFSEKGTGKLDIIDAIIENNRAGWNGGGGIYINKSVTLTIVNGRIQNNKNIWRNDGGGIYIVDGGKVNITTSIITGNSTPDGNGGGIYVDNAPYSYSNLTVDSATTFSGNRATTWYTPPKNVSVIYNTIDNTSYSSDTILTTLIPASPLNNYDINLVAYRVILTLDSTASWSDLGNIGATFTLNSSRQTAVFSNNFKEYSGYPTSGEYGIQMLSAGTWGVNLNLPYGYSYEVSLNGVPTGASSVKLDAANVKYIEIKVKKTSPPPWGKWIYRFK